MGQYPEELGGEIPEGEARPVVVAHYHTKGPSKELTLTAEKQYEQFLREYNQRLRKDLEVSLKILIWGPGIHADSPVADKRWEIREALRKKGHTAFFSEDVEEDEDIREQLNSDLGLILKVYRQAEIVDYVIVLVDEHATGVISELHLCSQPNIAAKVFVVLPKTLEEGFFRTTMAQIRVGNGAVFPYTEEEFRDSVVFTTTLDRVQARCLQVALRRAGVIG